MPEEGRKSRSSGRRYTEKHTSIPMYRARTHITERTHTAFIVPQLGSAESGAATKLRPCRVKLRPKTSAKAPTMSPRISERFVLAGRHNGAIATIV